MLCLNTTSCTCVWILCLEYHDKELRPCHVNFQKLAKLNFVFENNKDKMIIFQRLCKAQYI